MYSVNANKEISLAQTAASTQNAATQINGFVRFGELINAPTVVTQPAPVVITQPTPIVVRPEVVQPQIVNPILVR